MRYFMINPYKDIPKYAEVKMIRHCFDSGYSCYEVEYKGQTYKPFERDVKGSHYIKSKWQDAYQEFLEWREIYDKTVLAQK